MIRARIIAPSGLLVANGSNARVSISGVMPHPSSTTSMTTPSDVTGAGRAEISTSPARALASTAFFRAFHTTWRSWLPSVCMDGRSALKHPGSANLSTRRSERNALSGKLESRVTIDFFSEWVASVPELGVGY